MLNARDIARGEMQIWCAGLPLVEDRLLRQDEKNRIRQLAWRLTWQGIGSFFGLLAGGILAIVGCGWWSSYAIAGMIALVIVVSALLLFLPATLFAREGLLGRGRLLFADLRRGFIREFSGVIDVESESDDTIRLLQKASILSKETLGNVALSILPVSHRVWYINGNECRPWITTSWTEVANLPSRTDIPRVQTENNTAYTRELLPGERRELLRYAYRQWLKPLPLATVFSIWLCFVLYLAVTVRPIPKSTNWLGLCELTVVTIAADSVLLHGIQEAWKLRQDVNGGHVEVRTASSARSRGYYRGKVIQGSSLGSRRLRKYRMSRLEMLPVSGKQWTKDDLPAAWRRIKRQETPTRYA